MWMGAFGCGVAGMGKSATGRLFEIRLHYLKLAVQLLLIPLRETTEGDEYGRIHYRRLARVHVVACAALCQRLWRLHLRGVQPPTEGLLGARLSPRPREAFEKLAARSASPKQIRDLDQGVAMPICPAKRK